MEFRIADTFTESLARLTAVEQKTVKTTAFDLQVNLANPSLKFHKLEKAKDKNFWSVRASSDLRVIVHRSEFSLLLCYVDHHDKAYEWAGRRKIETHPKTGAAQLVEIRETVEKVLVPRYVQSDLPAMKSTSPKSRLFVDRSDDEILGELFGQLASGQPRKNIGTAGRRKRHHDAHRFIRIRLRIACRPPSR